MYRPYISHEDIVTAFDRYLAVAPLLHTTLLLTYVVHHTLVHCILWQLQLSTSILSSAMPRETHLLETWFREVETAFGRPRTRDLQGLTIAARPQEPVSCEAIGIVQRVVVVEPFRARCESFMPQQKCATH